MRVVVLGAGFGGLEVATRLSEAFGDDADVVLVDGAPSFIFGFSKLDVMFGRASEASVRHAYADLDLPGVRFVGATVRSIDADARRVETDEGWLEADDALVIALGADLDVAATPGLEEGGCEFYSVRGAFGARRELERFDGGHVVIGVSSAPFKCPPAPSETALLVHDLLVTRGLRDRSRISLVMPLGAPVPPSPAASAVLLDAFSRRDITWCPSSTVRSLDPDRRTLSLADDATVPYDLYLGVPTHRAPTVVAESGLCTDGWIAVDPRTLVTASDGVWAIGDVTSAGTPKAGVFAEGHARVVADQIIARRRGVASDAAYDGRGVCYVEFGNDEVGRVDVTFKSGEAPAGTFEGPSAAYAADKAEFGSSRIRRWFSKDWSTH